MMKKWLQTAKPDDRGESLRGGGKRRKTFYRWRKEEENACNRSEEFDASLHFLSRPIRHQSQISGFRNQLAADRTYVRGTMVDKEPVLRTKNGRSFVFSPEWYPDLIKMCNASLHMLGFGADMVLALATDIYATRMLIDEKEAPMYTPSQDWAYEREAPPPSDKDGCDWDGLSESFMT